MRATSGSLILVCWLLALPAWSQDGDSDGDGLSDFQEIHKYHTDPKRFSTAGDGVSDGDWERRREFTYTIRTIIKVMEPVNIDCLNDDYQDAKVLAKRNNYVELEVIHYPLNTVAEAIIGNPNWRRDAQALKAYLQPGITTNWDDAMRRDLIAALKADGIDPDALDDKALVTRVSAWLMNRARSIEMFCTHYIDFQDGQPAIYPGLEARFEKDRGDQSWTPQEQFNHELFGREMFANRTRGTCTSSAVYLTTVLRALGIPTRMVLAIPVVDPTDPVQLSMVRENVHHHRIGRTIQMGLSSARGYANHTFNEVYIGGRWVRLNYSKLGQNILDSRAFGLLTHVNTFNDLSEAHLAATWGKRYALGERDEVFPHSNPYRATQVSDHFGKYAQIDNPQAPEHRFLTLTRAYWPTSPECPREFPQSKMAAQMDPKAGYILVHAAEWFADESYGQYSAFLKQAPKEFLFRSEGHPDVHGRIWGSFTNPPETHEIGIVITPEEFARMEPGVEYELVPQQGRNGYEWKTQGRVIIQREK